MFSSGTVWLVSSLEGPEIEVLMSWFNKYLEKETPLHPNPLRVEWKQASRQRAPWGSWSPRCVRLWVGLRARMPLRVSGCSSARRVVLGLRCSLSECVLPQSGCWTENIKAKGGGMAAEKMAGLLLDHISTACVTLFLLLGQSWFYISACWEPVRISRGLRDDYHRALLSQMSWWTECVGWVCSHWWRS